jgi:anti-sigma28 factor (negative regulator of flagellin synthesis)
MALWKSCAGLLGCRICRSSSDRKTIDASQHVDSTAMESSAASWIAGVAARHTAERLMNPIQNVGPNAPLQKITAQPIQKEIAADAPRPIPATDRLELSGVGHMLKALKATDVRTDKVADIKSQIEAGKYDTDGKKLDASLDKLLDDLTR